MSSGTDISALYREFTDALTKVLAENAVGPARRGRLARAAVKSIPITARLDTFSRSILRSTIGKPCKKRGVRPTR
jgi:hypothetical protein